MRYPLTTLVAAIISIASPTCRVAADEAVVNTPTVVAALKGEWELQPAAADGYKQRLTFDGSRCGEWKKSKETLPASLTFYVEGNELLLRHYYEPKGAFNYRLKQLRYRYKLDEDKLALTTGDATETWARLVNQRDRRIRKAALRFAEIINSGEAEQLKGVADTPFVVPGKDGLLNVYLGTADEMHRWFGEPGARIELGDRILGAETFDQHIQIFRAFGAKADSPELKAMKKAVGEDGVFVTLTTVKGVGVKGVLKVHIGQDSSVRIAGCYQLPAQPPYGL